MSSTTSTCPRCQRTTQTPFAAGGVCLRCAGVRALALDLDELTDSLEQPTGVEAVLTARQSTLPERIGPYEIVDELGRGGMARVFAARQPRLDRLIALKVLASGPASEALEQRFLREIQTVARLRHPNIVAIHDSGRAEGYVYFAMDFIEGGDFAHRLRERPPGPRTVAAILERTASALAYAHGEGVLHRDLKPSNILLDGDEPRLADFGLAAQLETGGDLTVVSAILGTPHYLSPEVARSGSGAFTPQSDLYALGIILYEALAGRTPFAGASAAELPALLQNSEPPPVRLLAPATPRELETICLKCLEREPARRYAGVAALAEDLRRYLANEPILARPPGHVERLRRFTRRHRIGIAAGTMVIATLSAGIAVSTTLAIRATQAEKRASREAAAAAAVISFLKDDLLAKAAPDQQPDPNVTLRTILDRASVNIGQRFAAQPDVEMPIREVLGVTYDGVGAYQLANDHLVRALAIARERFGPDDPRTINIEDAWATTLIGLRRHAEAIVAKKRLLAIYRQRLGEDHSDTLTTVNDLATLLIYDGKPAEAEPLLRDAIPRLERTLGPRHAATINTMSTLTVALTKLARLKEAAELSTEVVARARAALGNENSTTLIAINSLASIYGRMGELDQAVTLLNEVVAGSRKTLGNDHPNTLNAINSLAVMYLRQRKLPEAATLLDEALTGRRRVLGPTHPQTLSTEVTLAGLYRERHELDQAIALFEDIIAARTKVLGAEHPDTIRAIDLMATCYGDKGNLPKALELHLRAFQLRKTSMGAGHAETIDSMGNLASDYLRLKDPAAAEAILREALPLSEKSQAGAWQTELLRLQLGTALTRLNRLSEAESFIRSGYEGVKKDQSHIPTIARKVTLDEANGYLAEFLTATGKTDELEKLRGEKK